MSPQDKAAARYKDKAMQGTYENALKVARGGGAELFTEDGRQRRAGSLSVAFWNGYDGREPGIMEPASSMARAAFMAGRSFAKERPGVLRPVGKPATGAAMTKEHDMTTPQDKAAEALRLADWLKSISGANSEHDAVVLICASELLREYAALLQAQPAEATAREWQPIDTAPKDGRYVMVWPPTWQCQNSCARWNDDRYSKRPRPYWSRADAIGVRDSRDNPPTHWMPLQQPPKEQP